MRRLLLLVTTLAAINQVSAATLCSQEEQVVFSCTTAKNKVVSLCSSSPLTDTAGYLQYRFGVAGQTAELSYPTAREHPKKNFQSGTMMYSGGGGAYLKFSSGDYTYAVFTAIGKGFEKEGVVVTKAGKQVAYLACQGPWTSELGPDFFEKTRSAEDPQESDFDVP